MVRLSPLTFRVVGETSRQEETALASAPDDLDHVGLYLREARESLGRDVDEIALALRIRPAHLEAIEDGRFGDLPGPTYAVGFIRTYADFLGLDGAAIVARFKSEAMAYSNAQPELDFIATPEGRFPSGAVVFVGLLLAVGGFVGWSYIADQSQSVVQRVAEPPALVSAPPAPANQPSSAQPASSQVAAATPDPVTASPAPRTAVVRTPEPQITAPSPVIADTRPVNEIIAEPTDPAVNLATLPVITNDDSPEPATPTQLADVPPADRAPSAPAPAISPGAAVAAETETAPTAPEVAALPAVPAVTAAREGGRIYGQANSNARIILTATVDSWVQVRDDGQNVLLTRMLQPGDSYRVPDQAGLTLLTGNAGGLRVEVDGTAVPSLGPLGAVRRDIPLDPDALRDNLPTP